MMGEDIVDRLRKLHSMGQCITSGNSTLWGEAADTIDRFRAEVASLKEELAATQSVGLRYARENADLTQQLAAANSNSQQLRGALELAQLTLANYFEATRRMPECNAIDQNVGQVIKDALAATPDKFNPDWSLLEATQESLREHMALLAAANGRVERMREIGAFLLGESAFDGVWFGDKHPNCAGNFWWRTPLRAALSDLPQQFKSEDARDAARYRYLRDQPDGKEYRVIPWDCDRDSTTYGDDLDDAIDAALSAQENKS